MKRRHVLKATVASVLLVHPAVRAQMMNHSGMMGQSHGMDMGNNAVPEMGHGMMSHGTGGNLMPVESMPEGLPLDALPMLVNKSGKTGLFKATIEAAPTTLTVAGRKPTEFWLYNGQLPGPQIQAYEGDEVEITFVNNLPEPTTIHWHGMPVPSEQDGNPQNSVAPGEQRVYKFSLPEGSAGTYWYHPHPHGKTAMQVARGLAGTFVVKSRTDPLQALPEQYWMISDLRLNHQAEIPPNTMMDWMDGREGQFVLINGQRNPAIRVGTATRVRIWNSCAARYLQLEIPGCQWQLLGTDGGLLEQAQPPVDTLFLAPAERVEVLITAPEDMQTPLISRYYDRAKMMMREAPTDMLLAHVSVQKQATPVLPAVLKKFEALEQPVASKYVEFSEHDMPHDMGQGMSDNMMQNMFLVNGKSFDMQRVDLRSRVGDVEEWHIYNNSHMDHPFHLHGTQFVVTVREQNGIKRVEPFHAWRDTVNLRPYETVTFLVKQSMPGLRMFHCHILEHEDLGMMANLLVE